MNKELLLKEIKNNYLKDAKELLIESIKIPSIYKPGENGFPFGQGNEDILQKYLKLLTSWGGTPYRDPEGYYGFVDFGTGKEHLGLYCHLDVVTAGEISQWDTDPFDAIIKEDNYIYGRGSNDTKGPNVAAIFAVKYLLDNNYDLSKVKIRIYLGLNEEGVFTDINKYIKDFGQPKFGGIISEPTNSVVMQLKGKENYKLDWTSKEPIDFTIIGGREYNMVCDFATVNFLNDEVFNQFKKAIISKKYKHDVNEDTKSVNVHGKPAHGSIPEFGLNAVLLIADVFKEMKYTKNNLINFLYNFIDMDVNLTKINGDKFYQTGRSTFSLGFIKTVDNKFTIGIDSRFPPETGGDTIMKAIFNEIKKNDIKYTSVWKLPSFNMEPNKFSQKLLDTVNEYTIYGKMNYVVMGGCSYSNVINNGITIGINEDYINDKKNLSKYLSGNYIAHSYNERYSLTSYENVIGFYVNVIKLFLEQ